jgi:hypothetical protein
MFNEMKIMVVLTIKNYKQMKTTILTSIILLTVVFAAGQNIRIGANMVVTPGTKINSNANLIVESGELELQAGATLIMGNGRTLTVNNGGTINILGNASEQAVVTSTGYFMFVVNGGGTLGAQHAVFEKMSGSGLTIQAGATIDPANPLHNSVFQSGAAGATMLTVNNNQVLSINGVAFIKTGTEAKNVAKTVDVGEITFTSFSGNFAGAAFENDIYNRIHWSGGVPENRLVQNVSITPGTSLCFDALQTITVEDLLVQNGGSINLIAGQNIILLPGVIVQNGGYLHAFISTNGIWCNPGPLMASFELEDAFEQLPQEIIPGKAPLRAYPNPTTGTFTLEISETADQPTLIIEVYSMLGVNLLSAELPAETHYTLDLTGRQPGMYIVRVIRGQEMDFVKVVKQ